MATLPPFDVGPRIARGGSAEVWRGRHAGLDLDVAIKVLRATGPHAPDLRTEVETVAALCHPNVVALYDAGTVPAGADPLPAGAPYLVMELAAGTAREWRPPSFAATRRLLLQVLDALAHVHARGIVHGDLKPENLLRFPYDLWKLADFGLSGGRAVVGGRVRGTPRYMAPEQFRGEPGVVGPWSDLYAVGCTAWELVAGTTPFEATRTTDLARAHAVHALPELELPAGVPRAVEGWLRRLLAKHPAERFRCAADAREALLAIADRGSNPPTPPPAPTRTSQPTFDFDASPGAPSLPPPVPGPRESPFPERWGEHVDPIPPPRLGTGLALCALRELPLVGRRTERDWLWSVLREVATTGRPRVALLTGPGGVGKSRLARWLTERADELGAATGCFSRGDPITDGIRAVLGLEAAGAGDVRERAQAVLTGRWADVSPESVAAAANEPGERPLKLKDRVAILCELVRATGHRPLALAADVADDVGQALVSTLAGERVAPAAVLLVATLDDEAATERTRRMVEASSRDQLLQLHLGPLPTDEHRQLVRGWLGLDEALWGRVAARTNGHPGLAVAIVVDLVRRGRLVGTPTGFRALPGTDLDVPEDLRVQTGRWLESGLRDLPDGDRHALHVLAALGRSTGVEEWLGIAGAEPAAFGRLADRGLVERRGAARVAVAHELLRVAILDDAAARGRLPVVHARIAEHLSARGAPPEAIGIHLARAGGRDAEAARALHAGALNVFRSHTPVQALTLLDERDRVLDRLGLPPDAVERLQSLSVRSGCHQFLGEMSAARTAAEELLGRARRAGDEAHAARALGRLAEISSATESRERVEALYREAIATYRRLGDEPYALVLEAGRLAAAYAAGRRDEVRAEAPRLYASAPESALDARYMLARRIGEVAFNDERWEDARAWFQRALDHATENGVLIHRFAAALDLARLAVEGDSESGEDEVIDRARVLALELGEHRGLAECEQLAGLLLLKRGDAEGAYAFLGRARRRLAPADRDVAAYLECNLAMSAAAVGRWDEARSGLGRALKAATRLGYEGLRRLCEGYLWLVEPDPGAVRPDGFAPNARDLDLFGLAAERHGHALLARRVDALRREAVENRRDP